MKNDFLVEYKGVDVYQEDKLVLNNIDFSLTEGEFAYIIGRSGSGKSSFLKSLTGDLKVQGDKANVASSDILSLKAKDRYKHKRNLGVIFQDFKIFKDWTVARNLRFVLYATDWKDKQKVEERINKVLKAVGLLEKREDKTYTLSGGEQQRLAIARAILNNPKVIIADEPTGNLDPETSDEILQLLYEVAKENKSAILLATHDYRVMDKFKSRVFLCENGNIKEA